LSQLRAVVGGDSPLVMQDLNGDRGHQVVAWCGSTLCCLVMLALLVTSDLDYGLVASHFKLIIE
jgi:hypothetical protein